MAYNNDHRNQLNLDNGWIGRSSFTAATSVVFLNVVPVVVIPFLWIFYLVPIPIEAVIGLLLLPRLGAGRQTGIGILIGLLASAAAIGVSLLIFNGF